MDTNATEAKNILIQENDVSWNLPHPDSYFTGRVEAISQIQQMLDQKKSCIINQAIATIGGIGKSALAQFYAHQSLESKRYNFVVWLEVWNQLSLLTGFQKMAIGFGMSAKHLQTLNSEETVEWVYQKLAIYPKVLLIFDNPTKLKIIRGYGEGTGENTDFLPPKSLRNNFHLLITTSNQQFSKNIPTVSLSPFDAAEACQYIKKHLPTTSDEMAGALAKSLAYFPLALNQAVAFIKEQPCTIEKYLDLCLETQSKLLEQTVESDLYEQSVLTTWNISAKALYDIVPLSKNILNIISYLGPTPIPLKLLITAFEEQSKIDIHKALQALSHYLLINWNGDTDDYSFLQIPALVQAGVRQQLIKNIEFISVSSNDSPAASSAKEDWLEKAYDAWCKIELQEKPKPGSYALLRELIPHGEMLAYNLMQASKSSEAEKALQLMKKTFSLLALLGRAYGILGNAEKKKSLLERAIEMQNKNGDIDYAVLAKHFDELADAHKQLDNIDIAQTLLLQAIEIKKKHYGEDSIELAETLRSLAIIYGDLGEPLKQKPLLEHVLAIQEKFYDKDHIELAMTTSDLAGVHFALRDMEKAKSLWEKALIIIEKHYGKEHWEVAKILGNLGCIYGILNNPLKQKELLERALIIEQQVYGESHVETAITMSNLASAYLKLKDFQKAKELLELSLEIKEKHYGKNHVSIGKTLGNLGQLHSSLGNHSVAKELLERALVLVKNHYGPIHSEVTIILRNLLDAYQNSGDVNKHIELLELILRDRENYYGKNHLRVGQTLKELAGIFSQSGNNEKALALYIRAHAIYLAEPGEAQSIAIEIEDNIKRLRQNSSSSSSSASPSAAFFSSADPADKALKNLKIINEKGVMHFKANRYEEALKYFEEFLKIQHEISPGTKETSIAAFNLGTCYWKLEQYDQAIPHLQEALTIRGHLLGEAHAETQKAKLRLEDCKQKQKELKTSSRP